MVSVITIAMTFAELLCGYLSSSMALLSEGWHMASHAGVMLITFFAYRFANSESANETFSFGAGKFIPLGGYTNAIILAIVALLMGYESVSRFLAPVSVRFDEAILVAAIGLGVNIVSVLILGHGGHSHGHDHVHEHHHEHNHDHDHELHEEQVHRADVNLRSAYTHILADTLTTVFTLAALITARFWNAPRLDAVMGFVGSIVILTWAYRLSKETLWDLLDGHSKDISRERLKGLVEDDTTEVIDLHIWRIAPHVNACEIVLATNKLKGTHYYRRKLASAVPIKHLIVEEVLRD